ncbi:hypothetical protein FQN55_001443 [Onygenales sp. PD_40]|nr:hypothetical protein FQN55_001443 [Onygenales sp. PD_40]
MISTTLAAPSRAICARCFILRARRQYHDAPSGRWRPRNEPKVVPDSLSETLRTHQDANRPSLIRKIPVPENPHSGIFRPKWDDHPTNKDTSYKPPLSKPELHKSWDNDRSLAGSERTSTPRSEKEGCYPHLSWTTDSIYQPSTGFIWLDHIQGSAIDGISRLDEEIKAYETYMVPNAQERDVVSKIHNDITRILRGGTVDSPILIGSRRTGMAVPHSSIDFLIPIPDPHRVDGCRGPSPTRPKMVLVHREHLRLIDAKLRASHIFSKILPRREEDRILTAIHGKTGLQLSFRCATDLPASLDLISYYNAEFPSLRPLYLTLRMVLETRGILGRSTGTVDSYGLMMMIVAALKIQEGKYHRQSIGQQLLHVLEFYLHTDFTKYGISIEPPSLFQKTMKGKKGRDLTDGDAPYLRGQRSISKRTALLPHRNMLCLQDPADFMHDLGTDSVRMSDMQHLFQEVYDDINSRIRKWDGDCTVGDMGDASSRVERSCQDVQSNSMLALAVGANYEDMERFRDMILLAAKDDTVPVSRNAAGCPP